MGRRRKVLLQPAWILTTTWLVLSIVMVLRTLNHGDDFEVFWQAARGFWAGAPVFSTELFGNMVFKYPPWILPVFFPLAVLPLALAKVTWGVLQAGCVAYVLFWLRRRGVRDGILVVLLLAFGGILFVHALVGQVTLPLLVILLYSEDVYRRGRRGKRFFWLLWAASVKIFTLFPFLGVRWRGGDLKRVGFAAVLAVALSAPIAWSCYEGDWARMTGEWWSAMFSGTQDIQSVRIGFKTREVQGLPSFFLRLTGADEHERGNVIAAILTALVVVAGAWKVLEKRAREDERWLGWIALTPLVQPLGWFHFYWLAFPLCAVALEWEWRRRDRVRLTALAAGIAMITAMTEKTLGAVGHGLELASVKTWGVVLVLGLVLTRREAR